MAIRYYPNRAVRANAPAIDRQIVKRAPVTASGRVDITSSGLDVVISANNDWQIDSILFEFSGATARDYSAKVVNGRKIVSNLNDYLWIHGNTVGPQRIILDPGFYNGTQLATELETQLDANAAFAAEGITFTVSYSDGNGTFTITPSKGTIKYLNETNQVIPIRDSIAGHLFGFEEDSSAFAASITSDTAVHGLNTGAAFIDQTAAVVLEHYHDDVHTLSVDQALKLESSTAAIVVTYAVVYEELI